jgi:hypothetical protein
MSDGTSASFDRGPPAGRWLVCVLTRDAAIAVLTSATSAPMTRSIRGIRPEVELGVEHGLPEACVISCDNVITIPLDPAAGRALWSGLGDGFQGTRFRTPMFDWMTVKCPRSSVSMSLVPSRSAAAITDASTLRRGEQRLDRFSGEFGHGDPPTLGFMSQSGVEIVGQLHRRPLHICRHTLLAASARTFPSGPARSNVPIASGLARAVVVAICAAAICRCHHE